MDVHIWRKCCVSVYLVVRKYTILYMDMGGSGEGQAPAEIVGEGFPSQGGY
jgi:hypothetical protein